MNSETRRLIQNCTALAHQAITSSEPLSPDQILETLSKPLPNPDLVDEAILRHEFKYWVEHRGTKGAWQVVSFKEAVALSGKSEGSLRRATSRKRILQTTQTWRGRQMVGVYLFSLARYCGWSIKEWQEAGSCLEEMRSGEAS